MESNIIKANIHAAENALEYLAEIKTYDLRELGEERFKTLIDVITTTIELIQLAGRSCQYHGHSLQLP